MTADFEIATLATGSAMSVVASSKPADTVGRTSSLANTTGAIRTRFFGRCEISPCLFVSLGVSRCRLVRQNL